MRLFFELMPYRLEQAIMDRAPNIARKFIAARTILTRGRTGPAVETATGKRRMFVDLAVISSNDAGTGIQRVVRELAHALLPEVSAEWDIQFVSATKKKPFHRIAWPDRSVGIDPEEMRAMPGDVFLGLDYSLDAIRRHSGQLSKFRQDGGSLWFLVHDLLPLHRPEWFSKNTVIRYRAWLGILASLADGFLCNSPQTEAELKQALADIYGLMGNYQTQVLPMGHTFSEGKRTQTQEAAQNTSGRFDLSQPFALMVGTLEPRKGHADVIAAFDKLWRRGRMDRLVLVGRLGWAVETLHESILAHPEHGSKLFWFDDVEDGELCQIYGSCTGLIIASHAEGFGLPLIEALGHGKPVLARDLPVFRLHEGQGVQFYSANAQTDELADATEQWLDAAIKGNIRVVQPEESSWRNAAQLLFKSIKGEPSTPYRQAPANAGERRVEESLHA